MHARFKYFLIISLTLLALDQATKWWARAAAEGVEGRSIHPLWAGVFELKLVYNEGVAFGMLQGGGVFLTPIAIVITAFAAYYSYKHPQETKFNHLVLALLASGAVGNLIDRLAMGKVTDMFWFRLINFPVFNVADICISLAGAAFVFGGLKELVHPTKPHPAEQSALQNPAEPQESEVPSPATSENSTE